MKRINILTKNVYNRIAAGEVVDRPYSAVKELVENSIDAGATDIEIRIEKGGKQLITVSDNGSGIYKDDLKAALMPHATSKISSVGDLDDIATLGFRGEALASISAVSKVEIISVTEDNPAFAITCEGGVTGDIREAALEKGTEISVRDLFYNTPVRAKFLKPDKKEEGDITSFVCRFILCRPEISFKYFADGKLVLQSFGGGLEEAVAQVYGAKTLSQCIKIDGVNENIHIYGFIGNQNFFKPNKSYQSLFLNGRYIVNNTIATAISNAYASYAMKRQFPFYVLNVEVPHDFVDVNVHPNKADVRFTDNRFIFGAVYKVISSVLDGTAAAAEFVAGSGRIPEISSSADNGEGKNSIYSDKKASELIDKYKPETKRGLPENTFPISKKREVEPQTDAVVDFEKEVPLHKFYQAEQELKNYKPMRLDDISPKVADNSLYEYGRAEKYNSPERVQERVDCDSCKFCGAVFNTYLIYEYRDCMYLIDQHAAHERLLYDRLKEKLLKREITAQPLLYPYIFDANRQEMLFIEKNYGVFADLGFRVEPFGSSSFRIDEIPADLQDLNVKEFFDEVLFELTSYKDIKIEDILKDKLATTACKHAVKGGMELTKQEADALFKLMDGDMGLKCPHGRPVCVKIDKREIEKMFKRIV